MVPILRIQYNKFMSYPSDPEEPEFDDDVELEELETVYI